MGGGDKILKKRDENKIILINFINSAQHRCFKYIAELLTLTKHQESMIYL